MSTPQHPASDQPESTQLRTLIGDLAHASLRPCEALEIQGMQCGPPGPESTTTEAHPIIRLDIRRPGDTGSPPLRIAAITARPTYDHNDTESPYSEADLEADLAGYVVSLELRHYPDLEGMPPYDIDGEALGLIPRETTGSTFDVMAISERQPFEDAVAGVRECAEALREARE